MAGIIPAAYARVVGDEEFETVAGRDGAVPGHELRARQLDRARPLRRPLAVRRRRSRHGRVDDRHRPAARARCGFRTASRISCYESIPPPQVDELRDAPGSTEATTRTASTSRTASSTRRRRTCECGRRSPTPSTGRRSSGGSPASARSPRGASSRPPRRTGRGRTRLPAALLRPGEGEGAAGRGRVRRRLPPHDPRRRRAADQHHRQGRGGGPQGRRHPRHAARSHPLDAWLQTALEDPPAMVVSRWALPCPHGSYVIDSAFLAATLDGCCNFSRYTSPEVESLAAEARTTVDPLRQVELYRQLDRMLIGDELLWVPLYYPRFAALVGEPRARLLRARKPVGRHEALARYAVQAERSLRVDLPAVAGTYGSHGPTDVPPRRRGRAAGPRPRAARGGPGRRRAHARAGDGRPRRAGGGGRPGQRARRRAHRDAARPAQHRDAGPRRQRRSRPAPPPAPWS